MIELKKPTDENAEGESAEETEIALVMSVEDVKQVIRNAVGPELLKNEDSLTVISTSFSRAQLPEPEDSGGYEKLIRYIEIARQSSMGILAICALLVLKIFAGARKKAEVEGQAVTGELGSLGMGQLPAGPGGEPGSGFRYQIASELKKNPEQVKQLFASWLAEDK